MHAYYREGKFPYVYVFIGKFLKRLGVRRLMVLTWWDLDQTWKRDGSFAQVRVARIASLWSCIFFVVLLYIFPDVEIFPHEDFILEVYVLNRSLVMFPFPCNLTTINELQHLLAFCFKKHYRLQEKIESSRSLPGAYIVIFYIALSLSLSLSSGLYIYIYTCIHGKTRTHIYINNI